MIMKKLLIQLRDHILKNEYYDGGLCYEIQFRLDCSSKDELRLLKYVAKHRPKRGIHFCREFKDKPHYWSRYLEQPRLDWLNYRIKLEKS